MIDTGEEHIVTLKSDGTVWTFGSNWYGELGDGTTTNRSTPIQVKKLKRITAIAAGGYHTVALKDDGTVWTFGNNNYGQLGDGTTIERNMPVKVPELTGVIAISAGGFYTIVLKSDGTVWTFGNNTTGQSTSTPVQIQGLTEITSISAGTVHTAVLKSDGTVWTFGVNEDGQLGDGTTINRNIPVQVQGLSEVTAIAAGYGHTAVLKSDGTIWAFGRNYSGQLGNEASPNESLPVQVQELTEVAAISAGDYHTVALKSDGTVWTFGNNSSGQLGDGTEEDRSTPLQVQGMEGITAIAAKWYYTAVLKSDGTVWTFGLNDYGQLGDGTTTDRNIPVQVLGKNGDGYLNLFETSDDGNDSIVQLNMDSCEQILFKGNDEWQLFYFSFTPEETKYYSFDMLQLNLDENFLDGSFNIYEDIDFSNLVYNETFFGNNSVRFHLEAQKTYYIEVMSYCYYEYGDIELELSLSELKIPDSIRVENIRSVLPHYITTPWDLLDDLTIIGQFGEKEEEICLSGTSVNTYDGIFMVNDTSGIKISCEVGVEEIDSPLPVGNYEIIIEYFGVSTSYTVTIEEHDERDYQILEGESVTVEFEDSPQYDYFYFTAEETGYYRLRVVVDSSGEIGYEQQVKISFVDRAHDLYTGMYPGFQTLESVENWYLEAGENFNLISLSNGDLGGHLTLSIEKLGEVKSISIEEPQKTLAEGCNADDLVEGAKFKIVYSDDTEEVITLGESKKSIASEWYDKEAGLITIKATYYPGIEVRYIVNKDEEENGLNPRDVTVEFSYLGANYSTVIDVVDLSEISQRLETEPVTVEFTEVLQNDYFIYEAKESGYYRLHVVMDSSVAEDYERYVNMDFIYRSYSLYTYISPGDQTNESFSNCYLEKGESLKIASSSYGSLGGFLTVSIEKNDISELTSITATKDKTSYNVGDILNIDDLEVTSEYSDGSIKTVSDYTTNVESIDMNMSGDKILKITYSENGITAETDIKIQVMEKAPEPDKYTITFNANGGTTSTTTKSVTYDSIYGTLPIPTRSGYSFKGWYTAKSGGNKITAESQVSITNNQTLYAQWEKIVAKNISVSSIKLNATSKTLNIKKTFTLKPSVSPSTATNKNVTYSSSNSSVATVSSKGVITAKKAGKAVITVTAKDGSKKKAQCVIKVKPAKPTSVKVKKKSATSTKITWKKVANATGYEVYRSTKKNSGFKKIKTLKGVKKVSFINKKLKKSKTYYYKVRAYKTIDNKKVYSSYSVVKKIKMK